MYKYKPDVWLFGGDTPVQQSALHSVCLKVLAKEQA